MTLSPFFYRFSYFRASLKANIDSTGSPMLRCVNHDSLDDGRDKVDQNHDEDASEEVDEGCIVQLVCRGAGPRSFGADNQRLITRGQSRIAGRSTAPTTTSASPRLPPQRAGPAQLHPPAPGGRSLP